MSYSRWGPSNFYTFWASSNATQEEDEIFECMYSIDESIIIKYYDAKLILKYPDMLGMYFTFDTTREQRLELLKYLSQFVIDVHKHYNGIK